MMTLPTLEFPAALGAAARAIHRAAFRWLVARTKATTMAEFQAFLASQADAGAVSQARLRAAARVINRYWRPRPPGPPSVVLLRRGKPGAAGSPWLRYVPRAVLERWGDDGSEVRRWMQRYVVALGPSPLRLNLVRSYVSYVHRVVVDTLGCRTTADLLRLRRDTIAVAILRAIPGRRHPQRLGRIAVNRFLSEVALRDAPGAVRASLHVNGRDLERTRRMVDGVSADDEAPHPALTQAPARERDHFTDDEVSRLLALEDLSTRDRLVLRILAETGLRRRAVAWLTVEAVYDRATRTARATGHATEKGLVTRVFPLSAATRACIETHLAQGTEHGPWLFPSPHTPSRPVSPATINCILVRACRAVGITGRHTHAHAMRKHVVCRLMQSGNSLDLVSKFLGHRVPASTWPRGGLRVVTADPHRAVPWHVLGHHPGGIGARPGDPMDGEDGQWLTGNIFFFSKISRCHVPDRYRKKTHNMDKHSLNYTEQNIILPDLKLSVCIYLYVFLHFRILVIHEILG